MKKCFVFFAIFALTPLRVAAQGIPSQGRDFYLGLLFPSYSTLAPHIEGNVIQAYAPYVLITSNTDNHFAVKYYDPLTGSEDTSEHYFIGAHNSVKVKLDTMRMRMTEPGELQEWKACHITADEPVTVEYFSTGACAGGSYLALPTQCLGRQYVAQSYHDNVGGVGGDSTFETASSYFMIIAPYNGTLVGITPTSTTKRAHRGVNCGDNPAFAPDPYQVAFNAGQCYMVKSAGTDPNCDLSGTTIVSDKPIVVIAGNENAFVDGSDPTPGGTDKTHYEARNYMVDQMLPVECWDTTGYFTIPFLDSQGSTALGAGDELRFFTGVIPEISPSAPPVSNIIFNGGNTPYTATAFAVPPTRVQSYQLPSHTYSTDKTRIAVEQVDQRMQAKAAPFPAPEEMTIVPRSHWATNYGWYTPAPFATMLTNDFITLICRSVDFNGDSIMVTFNGKTPTPIRQSNLAIKKEWSAIPDGYGLVAYTLACQQGSYTASNIATAGSKDIHVPFMIYDYGMWGWDVKGTLGDDDGDDYYWEYAHPAGTIYSEYGLDKHSTLSVSRQDECGATQICITDTGAVKHYIRYIQLIDYPATEFVTPPPVSINARLYDETSIFGNPNPGEIILTGIDSNYCFTVNPIDAGDSMNATVAIYDNSGTPLFVNIRSSALLLTSSSSDLTNTGSNSFTIAPTDVDSSRCGTIVVTNADANEHRIDSAFVSSSTKQFSFSAPLSLPVTLAPKATINIGVCFAPNDTGTLNGTVVLKDSCGRSILYSVSSVGRSGLLQASDITFDITKPGASECKNVILKNTGNAPLTIKTLQLSDATNFGIDSVTSGVHFPVTIAAGATLALSVCFDPQAEGNFPATIMWQTDISNTVASETKSVSNLNGRSSTDAVAETDIPASSLRANIEGSEILVDCTGTLALRSHLELYDLAGRMITEWNTAAASSSLPLPVLSTGMYILRATSGNITKGVEVLKN